MQPRVQVDIGQILALLAVKNFLERLTPAIRFSWWSVPQDEETRMNVRYRVTLTQYERNELRALLSGESPARKLKRPKSCWLRGLRRWFGLSAAPNQWAEMALL